VQPLSAATYRVELTVSAELREKIERARELVSHSVPGGELSAVLERALDALIQRETTRRMGAGRPRKERATRRGSRHVPVTVARRVWERDGARCTFQDPEGRRCSERRFLTMEHRRPFALGGPPTVENLCLLCAAHNLGAAREVFGDEATRAGGSANRGSPRRATESLREPPLATARAATAVGRDDAALKPDDVPFGGDDASRGPEPRELDEREKVLSALCNLGFRRRQAALAIEAAAVTSIARGLEPLLREALAVLVPG
jgi:hypothetical protein